MYFRIIVDDVVMYSVPDVLIVRLHCLVMTAGHQCPFARAAISSFSKIVHKFGDVPLRIDKKKKKCKSVIPEAIDALAYKLIINRDVLYIRTSTCTATRKLRYMLITICFVSRTSCFEIYFQKCPEITVPDKRVLYFYVDCLAFPND